MITVIIGPMFSGKSTELLRRLERARIAGRRVCLIRPERDTRDKLTHSGKVDLTYEIYTVRGLDRFEPDFEVIGIDEGQFLSGLVPAVTAWADMGRHILVAGLLLTSERRPFRHMMELLVEAEEIIKLNAVCQHCGSEFGTFTHYKSGHKTEEICVGGAELYQALCRGCYNAAVNSRTDVIEGIEGADS